MNLSLLQHDLRDPDRIRVSGILPGKVALVLVVPLQHLRRRMSRLLVCILRNCIENSALTPTQGKTARKCHILIPAKAGIHNCRCVWSPLDSGFRRNDVTGYLNVISRLPFTITQTFLPSLDESLFPCRQQLCELRKSTSTPAVQSLSFLTGLLFELPRKSSISLRAMISVVATLATGQRVPSHPPSHSDRSPARLPHGLNPIIKECGNGQGWLPK